ncbi:cytochrome c [Arenimonas fontis]|uniref:Cytochrome c n=1 Tax=Arenimonas fontis TaxID=2608255 RepID=A0A5B2ZBE3_9GAMM|nr:cytochrome c [Arenimonas fontis]KAA2284452.1 cytochrome c [Arenimonas fontis]
MRSVILVLIGLFLGVTGTLVLMNALRKGTAYPNGVMAVMSAQMGALNNSLKQNRCAATDLLPRLQTLRHLGNDLEPAFLPTQDDERFIRHASELRAAVDAALAATPSDCAAASVVINRIGGTCKACHDDFRG